MRYNEVGPLTAAIKLKPKSAEAPSNWDEFTKAFHRLRSKIKKQYPHFLCPFYRSRPRWLRRSLRDKLTEHAALPSLGIL